MFDEALLCHDLVRAARCEDPERAADAAADAARLGAPGPVLRAVYEALAANDRVDLTVLGHLLTAGMPYSGQEAIRWVQIYPPLAHTISVTTQAPSRQLARLLHIAGIPMTRPRPCPTVRSLNPADL